jgi:hypothetical protein
MLVRRAGLDKGFGRNGLDRATNGFISLNLQYTILVEILLLYSFFAMIVLQIPVRN